ncbi:MAG: XrtA system polysaccharide deacetylase [Planctomycetaceae bacterium]
MSSVLNAFTVDVEDYYHVSAFADRIPASGWDRCESRVVANTHRVLRLLSRHETRGTFFVLGWVADRFPALMRDIAHDGHEVGCHGYWHRLIYDQTEAEFRDDLDRARDAVHRASGITVTAYRAPCFSITARSIWALDVLAEEGFTLDSSIFPVHHDRYGMPGANRDIHQVERPAGSLTEFPPSVYRIGGMNLPVAGGGYFRLLPLAVTLHAIRRTNDDHGRPFMFYIHPWELDPDQPRLPGRLRSRWRHYQNLRTTEPKLIRLLQACRFGSATDALIEIVRKSPTTASDGTALLSVEAT